MTDRSAEIRRQVADRQPCDHRERHSIANFLEAFDLLSEPCNEFSNPVHVTASAIVVSDDRRRVLLHRHKRLNMWLQLGGHIDGDETPAAAALREAAEESGLPVEAASAELVHVDVHPGPRGHTHLDVRYLITAPHVAPRPPAGESQQIDWFHWHVAIGMVDVGVEGALRSLQPGQPRLRQARHDDAAAVAHVYARSRLFAGLDDEASLDRREVVRWMSDDVIGRADAWVADLDGTVVGLMVLDHDTPGRGWIDQLYIDPAWQRRGLGRQFVDIAGQRLADGVQTWVGAANVDALAFFARHGFDNLETSDGSGNMHRQPEVRMGTRPQ